MSDSISNVIHLWSEKVSSGSTLQFLIPLVASGVAKVISKTSCLILLTKVGLFPLFKIFKFVELKYSLNYLLPWSHKVLKYCATLLIELTTYYKYRNFCKKYVETLYSQWKTLMVRFSYFVDEW